MHLLNTKNISALMISLVVTGVSAFAINVGDLQGTTGNMGIGGNASGGLIDINMNKPAGSVGQINWNDFSNARNQNVDFGFSAVQQTLINRMDGNNSTNINNIKPVYGTGTSKITTDNLTKTDDVDIIYKSGTNSNVDLNNDNVGSVEQSDWKDVSVGKKQKVDFGFSAVPQRTIERIDDSKSQIIIEPQK